MLREDAGAILIQTLPDPHAAADQSGSVSNAAYNQYGVLVRIEATKRSIERF